MQRTLFKHDDTQTGASFSDCRTYRYTLWRSWGVGGYLNYLMLNPSTADEATNDPTVERCERRARQMGFGGLIVTNLFALRETNPDVMRRHPEPVGSGNDDAILESASQSDMVICAWGNDGKHLGRDRAVRKLLADAGVKCHALKITKEGQPWHPLYVGYDVQPVEYEYGDSLWA